MGPVGISMPVVCMNLQHRGPGYLLPQTSCWMYELTAAGVHQASAISLISTTTRNWLTAREGRGNDRHVYELPAERGYPSQTRSMNSGTQTHVLATGLAVHCLPIPRLQRLWPFLACFNSHRRFHVDVDRKVNVCAAQVRCDSAYTNKGQMSGNARLQHS